MKTRVYEQVKDALEFDAKLGDDDYQLISYVLCKFYNAGNITIDNLSIMHDTLPSLESITRARRKLQQSDPLHYCSTEKMERIRKKEESEYIRFYTQIRGVD